MGVFWANGWNITNFLWPFFGKSPTGHAHWRIFMLDGSNDVDLQKGVPFVGFMKSPPQNSNLDGKILKVSYQNYCIDSNQILHNDRDHQGVIMGGPSTCPTNPRWQKPPFWKLHNFLTDFDEIWHNDTYWPRIAGRLLKFRIFENPRWRWQPSWKSQKLQYLSNNLTDLHEIMYCDAKLVFLLPRLLKNLGYIINK